MPREPLQESQWQQLTFHVWCRHAPSHTRTIDGATNATLEGRKTALQRGGPKFARNTSTTPTIVLGARRGLALTGIQTWTSKIVSDLSVKVCTNIVKLARQAND